MAKRPGGVTFVAILTWIGGFFDVLAGALVLLFGTDPDLAAAVSGSLTTVAILSILIGVVAIAVAAGLLSGSRVARIVVAIVEALSIAGSVWVIVATPTAIAEYFSIGFAVLILALLFSPKANAFFRR
ncbi:hypothetical protein ARHIZOSPH14_20770 [Agromyces rhizosphaerae]|uniref:DUF7144 domain-containing protein n=1 Tax=Agromyces rhizosphaerae TaxID=88374 RepID=A0A9W6CWX2_9MICO|nr:hypothetical protein [Agromyces rhizosphaerae]GLI27835.1 hypothetical protein ARHIZOSPH14_20770 [Agromyces rhizosphaerae]